jgi:hypothetical protein
MGIENGTSEHLKTRWVVLLVSVYVLFACCSNFLFPVFEAPDEPSHFLYSRLLAQGTLPVQTDPERSAHAEGFNPPLYYALVAPVLRLCDPDAGAKITIKTTLAEQFDLATSRARKTGSVAPDDSLLPPRNPLFSWWGGGQDPNWFAHPPAGPFQSGPLLAIHMMRFVSTLCGIFTLAGVFLLARRCMPRQPAGQLLAVGVVAFNPQFVYISSVLNSDNLVTCLATFTLWRAMVTWDRKGVLFRDALLIGVLLGLGTLAKTNMLFMAVPVLTVVWLRRDSTVGFLKHGAVIGICMAVIAGWFFIRNSLLYGPWDFFGWDTRARIEPIFVLGREHRWEYFTGNFFPALFMSYWGHFGWLSIRMPHFLYLFFGALSSTAVFAQKVVLEPSGVHPQRPYILLCTLTVALNIIALIQFNMRFHADQGRLLFPSIGALAVLIGFGLETLTRRLTANQRVYLAVSLIAALVVMLAYVQLAVIYPVYF